MRGVGVVLLALALAACASSDKREPFALGELIEDAPAYVAQRYDRDEMPGALVEELEAHAFRCEQSGEAIACGRTREAFASCFDVVTVRIRAEAVSAESNRRCTGVRR